jgi:transketolase
MRNAFFRLIKEHMRNDESIFLLVADMGRGLVEDVRTEFPERFLNVGIAEQNMIGVAAGLCNVGFRPFCYTISNFLIHRCFEQIRNDICLHKYPITLVGTSTGFDNGLLGPTHQIIDDIGCLKVLPNIQIYSPSSADAIGRILDDIARHKQPAYIRIGKKGLNVKMDIDRLNYMAHIDDDSDILVVTHGMTLGNCIEAAKATGHFSIYCMNRIKPIDRTEVKGLFEKYKTIIIVEDHFVESGLSNSLKQFFAEMRPVGTTIFSLGPSEDYGKEVGDSDYFADKYGYSPERIIEYIKRIH